MQKTCTTLKLLSIGNYNKNILSRNEPFRFDHNLKLELVTANQINFSGWKTRLHLQSFKLFPKRYNPGQNILELQKVLAEV